MKRDAITTEETLGELLEKRAKEYPDVDALVYVDRDYRLTWKEFNDSVDTIAKGLMALGVKKGDKLALWATN
ncbi:MAG: AMP-binding protein, partial [Methanomassiliicoccaceae archaeon]|nr:AMP-binding protein [Methanomassiliicoccaceae archaeon]